MTNPAPWPPPPATNDRYRNAFVRHGTGYRAVPLRIVLLWGDEVLVDAAGRVYCGGCSSLVDAAELGQPGNTHQVGLPFRGGAEQPVLPQSYLPTDELGPLYARIEAALTDGASIAQAMDYVGCSEADVRAVKAIRDRSAKPPPAKPREVWERW